MPIAEGIQVNCFIILFNSPKNTEHSSTHLFFQNLSKKTFLRSKYVEIICMLCMLSCFSHVRLSAPLRTAAHQAPLSTRFSRQAYWSGLPFPSPRDYISIPLHIWPRPPQYKNSLENSVPLTHSSLELCNEKWWLNSNQIQLLTQWWA